MFYLFFLQRRKRLAASTLDIVRVSVLLYQSDTRDFMSFIKDLS